MDRAAQIEVIDKYGWTKGQPLTKPIVHIGTDPRNDVVLEAVRGAGVQPLHAQLIASPAAGGYNLVNLAETGLPLGASGDHILAARTAVALRNGMVFRLGEFTLVFRTEGSAITGPAEGSHIGLSLALPGTQLRPNRSLMGVLKVSNFGDRSGVQFELEVEGVDPDCYEIEPGPSLASGAEMEVALRLHHRGNRPPAGQRTIVIRATAEQAYPGEETSVTQPIQILPCYQHRVRLISPVDTSRLRLVAGHQAPVALLDSPRISPQVEAHQPPLAGAAAGVPGSDQENWWAPGATTGPRIVGEPSPTTPFAPPPAPSRASEVLEMSSGPLLASVPSPVPAGPAAPGVAPSDETGGQAPELPATAPSVLWQLEPEAVALPELVAETTELLPLVHEAQAAPEIPPPDLAGSASRSNRSAQPPEDRSIVAESPAATPGAAVPEGHASATIEQPAPRMAAEPGASPTPTHDWWIEEPADEGEDVTKPRVLKLSVRHALEAGAEPTPGFAGREATPTMDWWASEASDDPRMEPGVTWTRPAVRLRATMQDEGEVEPTLDQAETPPGGDRNSWASR